MRSKLIPTVITYGILGLAGVVSFSLPSDLGLQTSLAQPNAASTTMRIEGVVRDFKPGHLDFGVTVAGGNGHYAGNVKPTLNSSGRPSFVGVATTTGPVNQFNISNGSIISTGEFVPMITVLGAAITAGTYDVPVTVNIHLGSTVIAPFGPFDKAVAGNVNKAGNPRKYISTSTVAANTPVWIEGRSWLKTSSAVSGKNEADWKKYLTFSAPIDAKQAKVLRNGDTVPGVSGVSGQASLKTYVKNFLDASGTKVKLKANQAIFFFELGTTDMASSAADMQDLVVLVTLGETDAYLKTLDAYGMPLPVTIPYGYKVTTEWKDSNGNAIPPHMYGVGATGDVAGVKGANGTGGISSTNSFNQWFSDEMGTNLSARYAIEFTQDAGGVWEVLNDDFFPIDNALLDDHSAAHNFFFTYNFSMQFTHHAGQHRFIEFRGSDDMWVYIDGNLAMDIGGMMPNTTQYFDLDRLTALSDNTKHTVQFFFAQRNTSTSTFRLRTNMDIAPQVQQAVAVSGVGD